MYNYQVDQRLQQSYIIVRHALQLNTMHWPKKVLLVLDLYLEWIASLVKVVPAVLMPLPQMKDYTD